MKYNWQLPDWPNFRYELAELEGSLLDFVDRAGLVSGTAQALPESEQNNAIADLMIVEALKTAEIEGEVLSRPDVASSIRNGLGLNSPHQRVRDLASAGAAELMLAVRSNWGEDLSDSVLLDWHRSLMQGANNVLIGEWRSHVEPMQVVELTLGAPKVLYEGPPSAIVPLEMRGFVEWFNASRGQIRHAPIRAGLAHLYFESIHPFENGNGRIGRALAEKALFQGVGRPLSERQLKVVRWMLDTGPDGVEGGVNASKYQRLTGVSKPTATRDLQELMQKGILSSIGGGRSTRYELNL